MNANLVWKGAAECWGAKYPAAILHVWRFST